MRFIKASCPSCGGNIELDKDKDTGYCSYCGSKIVKDKILIEHNGNISLNGLANEKSLIERAFLFIEDRSFINAEKYFERVLDINPHCSQAYIGKLMCKLQITDIQDLSNCDTPLEKHKEFLLAMRFASPEELNTYKNLNDKTLKNFDEKIKRFDDKIKALHRQAALHKEQLDMLNEEHLTKEWKRIISLVSSIISFVVSAFCPPLLFIPLVCILMFFIYNKNLNELDFEILSTQSIISQKNKKIKKLSDNDPRRNR